MRTRNKTEHSPLRFRDSALTPEARAEIDRVVAQRSADLVRTYVQGDSSADDILGPAKPPSSSLGAPTSRYLYLVTAQMQRAHTNADGTVIQLSNTLNRTFPNTPSGKRAALAFAKEVHGKIRKPKKDTRKNRNRVDRRNKVNGAKVGRRKAAKK